MKKLNLIILIVLSLNAFAQSVNDKIKILENNLNYWDKSKTKKAPLKERMAFYNANAVSVAVVKDYKIEGECATEADIYVINYDSNEKIVVKFNPR